jgi:hypothetical protein
MASLTVVRTIHSPASTVFETIADPRGYAQAIDGVTNLEILPGPASGAGLRFRQSRTLSGRSGTMDFEVTEYVPDARVRIVNETHGTVWDSMFTMEPSAGGTTLRMRMDARPGRLLARLMMPIVMRMIRKAVEGDMDAVKTFSESRAVRR